MSFKPRARKVDRPVGRPRSFNVEKALDRAMRVFRQQGYEGASLSDLTKAMRINRPSLYAAFGDKEALFRKVLDRYAAGLQSYLNDALKQKTARAVAERLLRGAAEQQTAAGSAPGCLTVQGALACGEEAEAIRRELVCRRDQFEAAIRERFLTAKKQGDLPPDSNPTDLARYVATLIQGMAVQAAGGATRTELERIVDTALQAF